MAFISLSSSEIEVGDFVTADLMTKIKDDLDALNAKTVYAAGLANGSFEVDSDSDGTPDNWTISLYPGGSMSLSTGAGVSQGERCIAFTHPGGAGNGGGRAISDYMVCDSHIPLVVRFILFTNNGDLKCEAKLNYYDQGKIYTTSETFYSSTANATYAESHTRHSLPPSGSRFCKLELIGGKSDKDTTGMVAFDGVQVSNDFRLMPDPGDEFIICYSDHGYSTNLSTWEKVLNYEVPICGTIRVSIDLGNSSLSGSGSKVYAKIYRNDAPIGSEFASTGWVTFTEDISSWVIGDTLQLYLVGETPYYSRYENFKITTNTPGAPSFINLTTSAT